MRNSSRVVWLTTILIMTGCAVDPVLDTNDKSGESSGVGTSTADPSQTFNTQVKPNVTICIACHSGTVAPNLTSYATLEGKFKAKPGATNPLVAKGVHAGPSLTASQRTAIVNWIDSLPSPSQTYDSQVKPIVSAMCLACHSGTVAPNLTSYATLEGRYKAKPGATNPLVAKGVHAGPQLTASQRTTIINWIDSLPAPSLTYETEVKPIVSAMCLACHSGTVAPNLTSYATLESRYKVKPGATNPLVAKGVHAGPQLTPAQASTIANWIDTLP